MEFFCLTCRVTVCGNCAVLTHLRTHDVRTLSGAVEALKAQTAPLLSLCREGGEAALAGARAVVTAKGLVKEQAAAACTAIRECVRSVRGAVGAVEERMIREVGVACEDQLKALECEADEWWVTASQLGACVGVCESALTREGGHPTPLAHCVSHMESLGALVQTARGWSGVRAGGVLEAYCDPTGVLDALDHSLVKLRLVSTSRRHQDAPAAQPVHWSVCVPCVPHFGTE